MTMLVAMAGRETTESGARETVKVVFRRRRSVSLKLAVIPLILALLALPSVAQTRWDLVTPDEEASDKAAPRVPGPLISPHWSRIP